MASINSMARFMLIKECGMGRVIHIVKAKVRAEMGAIINMNGKDVSGRRGSLMNNFTASAMG